MLEPADNVFDFRGQFGIVFLPAEDFVEDADELDDVEADVLGAFFAPMVQVEQFELEAKANALDDDVVRVQIAVVFARAVDAFDAGGERVQKVHGGKGVQALAGLAFEKVRKLLTFNVL